MKRKKKVTEAGLSKRINPFEVPRKTSCQTESSSNLLVECPVCQTSVSQAMMNLHITLCIEKRQKKETVEEEPVAMAQTHNSASASTTTVCPLCNTGFPIAFIQLHVDFCGQKRQKGKSEEEKKHCVKDDTSNLVQQEQQLLEPLQQQKCQYRSTDQLILKEGPVEGLYLIHEFLNVEESENLIKKIDSDQTPWKFSSFNGNCDSKMYGFRTQFGLPGEERIVRMNDPAAKEFDIPEYLEVFTKRLHVILCQEQLRKDFLHKENLLKDLKEFKPNECNCNSYETEKEHHLTAHCDDRNLSGKILMNLSMGCKSVMTFCHEKTGEEKDVELEVGTLQLVTGSSRYAWQHSMKKGNISGQRRVSATFREATGGKKGIIPLISEANSIKAFCTGTNSKKE